MDPYAVLRVAEDATPEQIASAHRQAVLRTHPDRGGKPEEFRSVQTAFELLSDPGRRARYDRERMTPPSWAQARPWPPGPSSSWTSGPRSTQTSGPQSSQWPYETPFTGPRARSDDWVRSYHYQSSRPRPAVRSRPQVGNPWAAMVVSLFLLVILSAGGGVGLAGLSVLAIPILGLAGGRLWSGRKVSGRGVSGRGVSGRGVSGRGVSGRGMRDRRR